MNKHIITNTNEESLNMPSQLVVLNNEAVHFYVDGGSLEEHTIDNEEPVEEDNAIEALLRANPQPLPSNTPVLGGFLKLLVERVSTQGRT